MDKSLRTWMGAVATLGFAVATAGALAQDERRFDFDGPADGRAYDFGDPRADRPYAFRDARNPSDRRFGLDARRDGERFDFGDGADRAVELGRRLFFDRRLSGTGRTSCATCHDPAFAFAQPRAVSIHDDGRIGERNAPSLIEARRWPFYMWDGRFPTLERQAANPFRVNGEMGLDIEDAVRRIEADPHYLDLFDDAFGAPPSARTLTQALAAYERTLEPRGNRFERFQAGGRDGLSPLEREGLDLFNGKGRCVTCHSPPGAGAGFFTDFRFHNIGAGRPRRGAWDAGRWRVTHARADSQAFRTPSLRNVAVTAPYMHDGSLETLDDVIDFYERGGRPNPNLSPLMAPLSLTGRERDALVAFLRSLTDDGYGPEAEPRVSQFLRD